LKEFQELKSSSSDQQISHFTEQAHLDSRLIIAINAYSSQESLRATQPGVFSEARPPSRAQVLEARGIFDSSGDARLASSPTPNTINWKKYPPVFRNVYADVLEGRGLAEIAKRNGIKERAVTNIMNRIGVRAQALDEIASGSTPRT